MAAAAAFASELAGLTNRFSDAAADLAVGVNESATARYEAAERRLSVFSTKFHDQAYLRAADFHYLMAPHGLVWPGDLPPFWGLLNEHGDVVAEAPPKQVRRVTAHVLRAVGKANARDLMKACGREIMKKEPEPADSMASS